MAKDTKVQQAVFTNWLNLKLREAGAGDAEIKPWQLAASSRTGVTIVRMLEVVSQKKLGKYRADPVGKLQELANLEIAFDFLKASGIKLGIVVPVDIWNGNEKRIHRLFWMIIYHFELLKSATFGPGSDFNARALGAKIGLLTWIQTKIPEIGVTNLIADWKDGRALYALVNEIARELGLGPLVPKSKVHSVYQSPAAKLDSIASAMQQADEKMMIGQLMTAEQYLDPRCGEKSLVTYLAQFTNAKRPSKKPKTLKKKSKASLTGSPTGPPVTETVFFEAAADADADGVDHGLEDGHVSGKLILPTNPAMKQHAVDMLTKVNHLFDAMDSDKDGCVSKFELLEWLREHRPRGVSVTNIQTKLGLDSHHDIAREAFVEAFVAGRLNVDAFDLSAMSRVLTKTRRSIKIKKKAADPDPEPEPDHEMDGFGADFQPPPGERPADWRVYKGGDLGGRCKIRVYVSRRPSDPNIRKAGEDLKRLLEVKKVHLRPDFEPWIDVDIDMSKGKRDEVFAKAETKITPMVFVDDEYIGGYEFLVEQNEMGILDAILDY